MPCLNGRPLQGTCKGLSHDVRAQVSDMLENGRANPNAANSLGLTALHSAASMDDVPMIGLLLAAGADVDTRASDGTTPLHCACSEGGTAAVSLLLRFGFTCDSTLRCRARPAWPQPLHGAKGCQTHAWQASGEAFLGAGTARIRMSSATAACVRWKPSTTSSRPPQRLWDC